MAFRLAALLSSFASIAAAQDVSVATDIGPVHSLVARVMDGVGSPGMILPPGVSPHGYAMRPSEARMLEQADVVFWVGAELEPWLEKAIGALAADARSVPLGSPSELPEAEHSEGETIHPDEDVAADDDHGEHAEVHPWLDPATGKEWLQRIAEVLSEVDPDNAIIYEANAEAGWAELNALSGRIDAMLEPVRGRGFIVFHDGYGAFEERFDIHALGSIALGDASSPSASRVEELREDVVESRAVCVFSEPQFNAGLVTTLTEGTQARTGVLDPLGSMLQPGMGLYPQMLEKLAVSLVTCLSQE